MERWLPVVGFDGQYEVSDQGRVRSLDRIVWLQRAEGLRAWRYKGKMLVTSESSNGYPTVRFPDEGKLVHVLVLTAFAGRCPEGMVCRHLDGDRRNAAIVNLRWGTIAENIADTIRHGRMPRGSRHHAARLNENIVRLIRKSMRSTLELANEFAVSRETVRRARVGIGWRHVR